MVALLYQTIKAYLKEYPESRNALVIALLDKPTKVYRYLK
jgi:hypothetical protein